MVAPRLKLISAPATDPITLDQAKMHLRVIENDEDALISSLIKAATQHAEAFTGRAFIDQTWDLYLDAFPNGDDLGIEIPKPRLIELVQLAYDDASGSTQIMPTTDYSIDAVSEPARISPVASTWPTAGESVNAVRVRFRAGYQDASAPDPNAMPEDICAAVKLILGTLFEHRELQVVGTNVMKMPWSAEQLLRQHRVLLGMA